MASNLSLRGEPQDSRQNSPLWLVDRLTIVDDYDGYLFSLSRGRAGHAHLLAQVDEGAAIGVDLSKADLWALREFLNSPQFEESDFEAPAPTKVAWQDGDSAHSRSTCVAYVRFDGEWRAYGYHSTPDWRATDKEFDDLLVRNPSEVEVSIRGGKVLDD